MNFLEATAGEIAAAVARKEISAEAVAHGFLTRIDALEPSIRAFAWHAPDDVLRQARAVDRGERRGPLAGVPLGVKDIFDTAGIPTEFFSPIHAGNVPSRDAAVVARLKAAGALVMGKMATTEFAFMHTGPTRNPHDLGRTPGSSSAGSGAGMAAGFFPLALGTQTAGSLLKPASFCGAFAYKPSFGLVSTEGVKPLAPSFDTVGWYGRCVGDLALVARALIAGFPAVVSPSQLRLAVFRSPRLQSADPVLRAYLADACAQLRSAGHIVDDLPAPAAFEEAYEDHRLINDVEGARSLAHERTHASDLLSDETQTMLAHADGISWEMELAAQRRLSAIRDSMEPGIAGYDGVLDLSTGTVALPGLLSTGPSDFIKVWNGFGVPQVNVPVQPAGSLPFGLQLFGARRQDARLLATAEIVAHCLGSTRLRCAAIQ